MWCSWVARKADSTLWLIAAQPDTVIFFVQGVREAHPRNGGHARCRARPTRIGHGGAGVLSNDLFDLIPKLTLQLYSVVPSIPKDFFGTFPQHLFWKRIHCQSVPPRSSSTNWMCELSQNGKPCTTMLLRISSVSNRKWFQTVWCAHLMMFGSHLEFDIVLWILWLRMRPPKVYCVTSVLGRQSTG